MINTEENMGRQGRMCDNTKISDLTVSEFYKLIKSVIREEVTKSPLSPEWYVPETPGELNRDTSKFSTSNHTEFDPSHFPLWGYSYKEVTEWE